VTVTETAPASAKLTREQLDAAGTTRPRVYIEAAPGSGKTMVAAERFGVLRYTRERDTRAVVAVSFTKSATRELKQRIRVHWGSTALGWPHRVVTLDTLLYELLTYLLQRGLIRWPDGQTNLRVIDTWKVRATHQWTRREPRLILQGRDVAISYRWETTRASRVDLDEFTDFVQSGVCTHDEVRTILTDTLRDPQLERAIAERLGTTMRALIVDEVFDANPLDLRLVELASGQGVEITIIGDPWQALYRFRGAGPEFVPDLVEQRAFDRFPLTRSFRFAPSRPSSCPRTCAPSDLSPCPTGPVDQLTLCLLDAEMRCGTSVATCCRYRSARQAAQPKPPHCCFSTTSRQPPLGATPSSSTTR
jgi:DNA helicase II / ATP-dependent DNA helicase PcrA